MPPNEEPGLLTFSTWDQWTACDVSTFSEAVDGCYSALLVLRDALESAQRERERYFRLHKEAWRMCRELGPPHPEWEMLFEEMMHIWRRFAHRGFPPPLPWMYPMAPLSVPPTTGPQPQTALSHFLEHPEEVIRPGDELQIHKIEMASPGMFSFKGIGEPIRQLRELIKDLWYRNRQEQQRGDLQILREKLEILSDFQLPVQQIDIISAQMSSDMGQLGDLVDSGKVSLEGEERRMLSESSRPTRGSQRKRRKRG